MIEDTKMKILGILSIFALLFGSVGAASAATSASVSTSATVPGVMGITCDKTALTYNLATSGVFVEPAEGGMTIQNTGNLPAVLKGKLSSVPNANLIYSYDSSVTLSEVDSTLAGTIGAGQILNNKMLKIKALTNIPAGTFDNNFVMTIIPI